MKDVGRFAGQGGWLGSFNDDDAPCLRRGPQVISPVFDVSGGFVWLYTNTETGETRLGENLFDAVCAANADPAAIRYVVATPVD